MRVLRGALILGMSLAGLGLSLPVLAAGKRIPLVPQAKPTPPEAALHAYVEHVRAQQAAEVKTLGSIWSPEGRLVRLARTLRLCASTTWFRSW